MEEIVVKIKWDESLGPAWMNMDNLKSCLFSEIFIGGEAKDLVEVVEIEEDMAQSETHSG